MPAYPNIAPSWADPQQASVLDSPAKKAIRALVGLLGGNDPSGQAMGVAGPLGMVAEGAARRLSPVLESLFAANPAAREAYERAQAAQLAEMAPDVLGGLPSRHAQALSDATRSNIALRGLKAGSENVVPRPLPSRTGFETAIPRSVPQPVNIPKVRPGPGRGHKSEVYRPALGFESKFSGSY